MAEDTKHIIKITNLVKKFKKQVAVNNLSFQVKKGELYGFLGLNGAGKTTTLNIILGLLKKDSGRIEVDGLDATKDYMKIRNKIGIVFQQSILDAQLTVKENLMSRAAMYYGLIKDQNNKSVTTQKLVDNMVQEFQLEELLNKPYGKLSGGQKRRVDIARALIHEPEILFLDEPTTGLDPNSRKMVWDTLQNIQNKRRLTIVLTTHYMEEANNCNYVIIIKKGTKLAEGTPSELKNIYSKTAVIVNQKPNENFDEWLTHFNDLFTIKKDENRYILKFNNYEEAKEFSVWHSGKLKDYELQKGTMDEVFLNVTEGENNV
ncbi:ABC transporter ATP-binding protein [[Mycoplasma] falconis]|uniref:ABC transporter ATP-binding protein n=1 Tax=[Mycoplasma] falconis TaxID=92403 RepID=A0A501XA18_9BACT|nr:ABC transporter ATP-binding protein [[Mycoplasma] falconis]TPE57360.1 ABC transporter ATP-binding protein [[Mycoplasma] falconis]